MGTVSSGPRIPWGPVGVAAALLLVVPAGVSEVLAISVPTLNIGVENADSPDKVATFLEIILLLTILSLAPAILLMMTSFTRLIVVFGFLRQAIGTQQMPPNQVLVGLARSNEG